MTAGTKAILLLSVVGLIVLVAWYGEAPPQGTNLDAGTASSQAKDPLLASASESRPARPARSSALTERRQPPAEPLESRTTRTVSERWGAFNQPQANRQSPPPPPARSRPSARPTPERSTPSSRQAPTLEMGTEVDTTVTGTWTQARWNALRDQIEAGSSSATNTKSASADTRPSASKSASQPARKTVSKKQETSRETTSSHEGSTHKVKPGDTLGHIAQQYYGKASRWELIADANPSVDPSSLRVGQELVIPSGPRAVRSESTSTPRSLPDLPNGQTHTIGEGETLSSIAEDHLGDERHWYRIYELNEKRIGDDPDRLVLGMVIAIP